MTPQTRHWLSRGLGLTRAAVGLAAVIRPQLARRSLGVDNTAGDDGGTTARMFGIRDVAIAAATLSNDPTIQNTGLRLGVLVDSVDVTSVLLGRRHGVSRGGTALIGGAATLFTAAGIALLPEHSHCPGHDHE